METYEGRKLMASWRRPPGHPRNVWLNEIQEDANALLLSTLWRSEIARDHGAAQRFTRTTTKTKDDDGDEDERLMSKMEG